MAIFSRNKNLQRDDSIQLGNIARDRITGYEGVVVAITEWLNGCRRISIQPQSLQPDGKMQDSYTFDAEQVERIGDGLAGEIPIRTGGPSIAPVQRTDPPR